MDSELNKSRSGYLGGQGRDSFCLPCACEFFKLPAVVSVVSDNKANKNNEDVVKKLKDVFSICFKNTKNCSICAATSPGLGTRHWQLVAANLERGGLECGEMTSDEASPFSSFSPFLSLHQTPQFLVATQKKQVRVLPPRERRGPPGPLSCWNCQLASDAFFSALSFHF